MYRYKEKSGLLSLNFDELTELLADLGEPRYRAEQVFRWLHAGACPDEMTNIKKQLRERLNEIEFDGVKIAGRFPSKKDDTVKYLFELQDGNLIEGVLMHYSYGRTLCISTQVGCNMHCAFCASTLDGKVRDLYPGEMLSQVLTVERDISSSLEHAGDKKRFITNIVMMGSGEPLENYENTIRFLELVTDKRGINISPRNISLSTCGLVDKIYCLINDAPHVTLSISLHAPNDSIRTRIMPVNRAYPMRKLLDAAKYYADTTGRRVIFEYALIKDVNSSRENANELSRALRGINAHVNVIPLNSVPESGLYGVTREDAYKFCAFLEENHTSATVRRSLGTDIEGACGQLRRRVINDGRV